MWQSRLTVCAVSGFTQSNPIGRKLAVPRHLPDGSESKLSPGELVGYGKTLLAANWTDRSRDANNPEIEKGRADRRAGFRTHLLQICQTPAGSLNRRGRVLLRPEPVQPARDLAFHEGERSS
jgi:hypothetical protein